MSNKELRNLASTFFLVSAILGSFMIIPAIWLWPMYSIYKNKVINDHEKHTALAVCSIIFAGLIFAFFGIFGIVSGTLLIVSNNKKK